MQIRDKAKRYAHNSKLAKKRFAKVKDMGALRKPLKAKAFKHEFEATYGNKVELQEVKSGTLLKGAGGGQTG